MIASRPLMHGARPISLVAIFVLAPGCRPASPNKPPATADCSERDPDACVALCERGEARGCDALAKALSPGDPERAAAALRTNCDAGHSASCNDLGMWRMTGKHGPRDLKAALALFQRGCDARLPAACANLGALWLKGGDGVAPPAGGRADRQELRPRRTRRLLGPRHRAHPRRRRCRGPGPRDSDPPEGL